MNTVTAIRTSSDGLPAIPPGHVGPVYLPGTGRSVWWTGRVAIGLRHQASANGAIGQSALWIQKVLLGERLAA